MLMFEQGSLDEESGDVMSNTDMNSNVYGNSADDEDTIPPDIIVTNENGRKIENSLKVSSLKRGEYRITNCNDVMSYNHFALPLFCYYYFLN